VSDVEPFKVGFLDEGIFREEGAFDTNVANPIRMRFAEAAASGELDRPVELVVRTGRGLPAGSAKAVRDAWHALADEGVLLIIGPGITDNCMAVVPDFESGEVPTINYPGTTRSRGMYGFHYQVGSLYDDSPLIARAIAARGMRQVAVIRDRSPIGEEFFAAFAEQCERSNLDIAVDVKCSPVAADLSEQVRRAADAGADALAYLGFGGVLVDLSRAMHEAGWDPPRFTTTAGMHFYSKSEPDREMLRGWVYVDQVDEDNPVLAAMLDRYEARFGTKPFNPITAAMYDMATLAVLGLRYATVHTPDGVMEGLERIHQVPAALGGAGTVMGFGPWERTALKGPDYLILRQMVGQFTVRYTG
jgi:ABC-type branched-subunit amino acid transport system substrate-binding protein